MAVTEPGIDSSWQDVLLREWGHCFDQDYAGRLWKLIGLPEKEADKGALAKTERPYTFDIEAALRQGCRARSKARYGWDKRLKRLDQARKRRPTLETLISELQAHHWFDRFIAQHLIIPYGSQAIEPLVSLIETTYVDTLRQTALWLLRSIGAETTARLARQADSLICLACVVHCSSLEVAFEEYPAITYYGCRACGQSLSFQARPQQIVAVLDERLPARQAEGETLRVNWLQQGQLFDFDRVEIGRASDEQVERFAVYVGNDTDPFRAPRYERMQCLIDPACALSPNTPRVLEQVFGVVEWVKSGDPKIDQQS